MRRLRQPWIGTAASIAVLLAGWVALSWGGVVSDLFLPGPDELWDATVDLVQNGYKSAPLWRHIADSLIRVFAGFGTGAALGTMLGLAMGYFPTVDALCAPFVQFLRPLPQLAYLVLLIVWLGIGEDSKITLLFLAALPVSAVAARDGVRNVALVRLQAAQSLGANQWQIFRHVVFPSALAEIFTGARLAIGIVYGTLIAAEIIAGNGGIGWMILDAGRFLRSDFVFVGILIIGLMGVALDRLLLAIEARVVHLGGQTVIRGLSMNRTTITRRALLRTAGVGGGILAMPTIVRAAPAQVNIAFFLSTSPFMISKGQGWIDEAAKTKVNWIEVGSGAEINTGVAAGSMDLGFGIGSSPTASGISQGIPYEVVAMMDNIGPAEEMTVRKSANIRTPADFKGKKVATPFGSTSHFRLLGFLKTNNLTQRDVTVLDMRPDAMVAAWTRGDIDAGYVWSPAKSKLLAAGGEVFKTYDKLEEAGYVIADVIIARTPFAAANPAMIAAMLAAYGRSLDVYTSKPDDAAKIVGQQAGVTAEVAKADMAEYDFVPLKTQLTPAWLGAPGSEGKFASVLKGTADFLVEQKSIRSAPAVTAFAKAINTGYLAKAIG